MHLQRKVWEMATQHNTKETLPCHKTKQNKVKSNQNKHNYNKIEKCLIKIDYATSP